MVKMLYEINFMTVRACLYDPTKSCPMILQNMTIFLGADYTIFGNKRMLKQQQSSCSTTVSSNQHFSFFTSGTW